MLKILKFACFVGRFLSLAPSLGGNLGVATSRIYSIFLVFLYTVGTIAAALSKEYEFTQIKLVVDIGVFFFLYISNIVAVANVAFFKKESWVKLILDLKKLDDGLLTSGRKTRGLKLVILFGVTSVVIWSYTIQDCYFAYMAGGMTISEYILENGTETLLRQSLFCYYYVVLAILSLIFGYYKALGVTFHRKIFDYKKIQLKRDTENCDFFYSVRNHWRALKKIVDTFNEIFGWTVLLSITYVTLVMITYLDNVFRNRFGLVYTLKNLCFILMLLIHVNSFIFMCDGVLEEAGQIQEMAVGLKYSCTNESKNVEKLLDFFKDYVPEFHMARFFSVERDTIFSISNTTVTFVIVLLQLNTETETETATEPSSVE